MNSFFAQYVSTFLSLTVCRGQKIKVAAAFVAVSSWLVARLWGEVARFWTNAVLAPICFWWLWLAGDFYVVVSPGPALTSPSLSAMMNQQLYFLLVALLLHFILDKIPPAAPNKTECLNVPCLPLSLSLASVSGPVLISWTAAVTGAGRAERPSYTEIKLYPNNINITQIQLAHQD